MLSSITIAFIQSGQYLLSSSSPCSHGSINSQRFFCSFPSCLFKEAILVIDTTKKKIKLKLCPFITEDFQNADYINRFNIQLISQASI